MGLIFCFGKKERGDNVMKTRGYGFFTKSYDFVLGVARFG